MFGKGKARQVPTKDELQGPPSNKDLRDRQKGRRQGVPRRAIRIREIDFEQAKANMQSGERRHRRKSGRSISQGDAVNLAFHKTLGWDPFAFYKKPGVAADSRSSPMPHTSSKPCTSTPTAFSATARSPRSTIATS